MHQAKCPLCGSSSFYVKDPEDQFETYELEMREEGVVFDESIPDAEKPAIDSSTSTFCSRCSWHGPFGEIGRNEGS